MSAVFAATDQSRKVALPDHIVAYNRAKVGLMLKENVLFFTSVLFSLEQKWDPTAPTAYTNGLCIAYNPDFFLSLSQEERIFLMLHEAMHVALMHPLRLNGRNHNLWNQAADHAINLMLIEHGFTMITTSNGDHFGLADDRFKGMSAEQIYTILEAENPAGNPNYISDLLDPGKVTPDMVEAVNDIIVRAATRSKQANEPPGAIPGDMELFLDKLLNPKLPWHQILFRYLKAMGSCDYSFKKPNRRFFPKHYLPSLSGNSLMDLTIAMDTSGSVGEHEFTRFVSEVTGIFRMMKPKKITLIQFDTNIKSVIQLKNLHDLQKVKFTGRGGTHIDPVLEWMEKNKPGLTLIFTDGDFRWSNNHLPKTPLIWLIHENPGFSQPIGKVLHYEV